MTTTTIHQQNQFAYVTTHIAKYLFEKQNDLYLRFPFVPVTCPRCNRQNPTNQRPFVAGFAVPPTTVSTTSTTTPAVSAGPNGPNHSNGDTAFVTSICYWCVLDRANIILSRWDPLA